MGRQSLPNEGGQEDAYPAPTRTPRVPVLLLISIRDFPSSFCGGRRGGCCGLCWLLPLLRPRVFTSWRAGPSARAPERTETVVILHTCAGQEVQKRGGQVRSIFKELFNFCHNLGLPRQTLVWAKTTSSSRTNVICTGLVIGKDLQELLVCVRIITKPCLDALDVFHRRPQNLAFVIVGVGRVNGTGGELWCI
jgi:hypothetical protein